MRKSFVLAALLLSGCAQTMTLPDGTQGHLVSCLGGAEANPGGCHMKAGETCPSGYDVVNKSGPQLMIRCKK